MCMNAVKEHKKMTWAWIWTQNPGSKLHYTYLRVLLKVYSRIVATVCGCAMAMGLLKNKALKMFFVYLKEIRYLNFFHHLPTTN